ncbi:hypothetical protein [Desulfopila sp. IMCC35008]|uniref:hypothetical protein n=1 Tax=Desulfopila sp. IMCC35008 TaxID=2653858 RepID=UPI0013D045B3|nr:hypothetical protein [Desulfopila sp. IMCC35008]
MLRRPYKSVRLFLDLGTVRKTDRLPQVIFIACLMAGLLRPIKNISNGNEQGRCLKGGQEENMKIRTTLSNTIITGDNRHSDHVMYIFVMSRYSLSLKFSFAELD